MEISPIPGIRVAQVTKIHPSNPELTFYSSIESAARPEEDSYSPANQSASGAEEPDLEELAEEEDGKEPKIDNQPAGNSASLSVFV